MSYRPCIETNKHMLTLSHSAVVTHTVSSHKYYDYEYCVVVNRSIYHQLCTLGPRERVIRTLSVYEVHTKPNQEDIQ